MSKPEFLKLGNHGRVRGVLRSGLASAETLARFDEAVGETTMLWCRLAGEHLTAARQLQRGRGAWRGVISRVYYAAYNTSRALRFFVNGELIETGEDHRKVGNLPDDFPDKHSWSSWLWELRSDRSLSDYDPWPRAYYGLTRMPADHLKRLARFRRVAHAYLRGRGVGI